MKHALLFFIALLAATHLNAQRVVNISDNLENVPAFLAGMYDRINDLWPLEAGKAYLLAFPAPLDGYYFGQDAQRKKVTNIISNGDGTYVVSIDDMEDLDDFEASQAYIITPTISTDTITHITSGIQTELAASPADKRLLHVDADKVVVGIHSVFLDTTDPRSSTIYDLQGRCVNNIRKGETYIINGKKATIK